MKLEDEPDMFVAESGKFFLFHAAYFNGVEENAPGVRLVQCAHNLQECGFAGTARAYDTDNFAFVYFEVDAFQYLQLAETFRDSF